MSTDMIQNSLDVELELTPDASGVNRSINLKVPQGDQQSPEVSTSPKSEDEGESVFFPPHESQANKLHNAWSEFLSTQDWQWFVTFTFKEEIHPESADKLFRVWLNKLNRDLYGQRWRKKVSGGVKWVRALEWQKRGVLHYHALISNVGYSSRDTWANCWIELGETSKAGFIKIDQYDESKGGAEAYLSKYVAKGGQIDISANFQANNQIPDHEQKRTTEMVRD